jgi:ERCC4-type nuclease
MERLIIDYREKSIIQGLEELSIPHQKENLAIGDIHCYFPNDFQICMERKTWQDLWASIIDGRYREQRSRLLEWMQDRRKVIYVLEGSIDTIGENKDTCLRTIHRLSLLYNIGVWRTKSVEDTVQYLKWFYEQKNMFEKMDPLQSQITQLSDSIKKKKDVQNPKNFLLAILQSITGISYEIAQQIVLEINTDLKSFFLDLSVQYGKSKT